MPRNFQKIVFLVKENNKILKLEGDCKTAYPPMCSFNWVLSLVGFDSGIFKSPQAPIWPHPTNISPYNNVCKGDHCPHSWMRDSCLWYSQILTTQVGMAKLKDYVTKFSYGNKL